VHVFKGLTGRKCHPMNTFCHPMNTFSPILSPNDYFLFLSPADRCSSLHIDELPDPGFWKNSHILNRFCG